MNKNFKTYALVWAIFFVVFQVICFVTPSEAAGMSKFGGAFWAGYIFIDLAFIGQLACAYQAFQERNLQKFFYKLPLITVSYTGLIIMLLAGVAVMAIPNLPLWAGTIVCLLVLAFTAVAVIKAGFAADVVLDVDEKVKGETAVFRNLRVEADSLVNSLRDPAAIAIAKKISEGFRYADPVSNDALAEIEGRLSGAFYEFKDIVSNANGGEDVNTRMQEAADKVSALLAERNQRCKAVKGR